MPSVRFCLWRSLPLLQWLGTTGPAELNIESCIASNNSNAGIEASTFSSSAATARLSNSAVTDNGTGLLNGGVILTRGNNTIEGNMTNTVGTIGSYTGK